MADSYEASERACKFKRGQQVRCIDDQGGRYKLGAIYTVGHQFACGGEVFFVQGHGCDEHWVGVHRFEALEPEKPAEKPVEKRRGFEWL